MSKSKLNGSAKLLGEALHAVVTDAVENANKNNVTKDDLKEATKNFATKDDIKDLATKDDIDLVLEELADTKQEIVEVNARVDTLNENTQVQFREVNKRLGKLEKGVEETVRIYRTH